ncbi:cytosine permease [Methanosphaera sp. ISO3-F5]|uniref:cytosine permease n=1 Tax=Methanosphaera sp. ISO3-F5 TaxID=1452353 RepID=UPI002B257955|nr:cytosine permease [Methanosphaera sp. ISO3-F5]WQH64706.1 cytosine permease [Methanosphaera sp. ISO3-F5]
MKNRTNLLTNAIIWFGVAISVSEIEAGIGIGNASTISSSWLPLILGHILGGILLFLVGYIGASLRTNAMEMTTKTFSKYGAKFFATLNVLQLVAWVAVLNAQGATAITSLNLPISFPTICIILAILIAIYVYIGLQRISKITTVVMIILTILLAALSIKLLNINPTSILPITQPINNNPLSFWNIFEISIAMPISWLPVISDYTKDAEKPLKATLISALAYTIASIWMYFIGIEIANIGPTVTIAQAILLANLGISGIIIIVISTVTTNFMAANSAGESAKVIYNKLNPKIVGIIVSAISAILAISGIMNYYINFLYLISSVFAPMAAVLLISYYCTKQENKTNNWYWNMFAWFAGFITYTLTGYVDSIVLGPTLLAIIVSGALTYLGILIKKQIKPGRVP